MKVMITFTRFGAASPRAGSWRTGLGMVALLFGLLTQASAHAVLMSSVPSAGDFLAGPAITMQLRFNSRVDGKRSRLTLVYPDGKLYPLDITPQSSPDVLNAPAHGLLGGLYKVRWQVLAADGHITRGEFSFTIR